MKKTKLREKKNWFIPFCLLVLLSSISVAQSKVTGVIKDDAGVPIAGVNILEKGTNNGAVSDFDGNFSMTLQKSPSQISMSYLGYQTQEKEVSSGDAIVIILTEDAESLDEVVVVGYGTVKRSDVTMAVSSVGSKSFEDQPVFRAEDALQSRASGVQVIKSSGAPGANIKIRVRGSSSLTRSSEPLLVVDGIVGGNINSINPNDIQSMDILKDASASAIYGARGANGVILITTKRGKGVPKIEVNYFSSFASLPNKLPQVTPQEYSDLYPAAGPVIDGGTDYQDEFFRPSIVNNIQLSAKGQEGRLKYYLSGNYVNQEGIVINTDYERLTFRSNLETKFGEKFKLGLNISGSRSQGHNLFSGGARASSDNRGGILSVLTYNPTFPVRNPDGTYYDIEPQAVGSILVNPIAVISEKNNNSIQDRLGLNLNLTYNFTPAFSYRLNAGSNTLNAREERYSLIPDGSSVIAPRASFITSVLTNTQLSNIFTYTKDFGKTNLILTGVYEITKNVRRTANGGSGAYSLEGLKDAFYQIELGTSPGVSAGINDRTLQSYVGRAQVGVSENFNITGSLRVDQSSTFRKENNTIYAPAVSARYSLQNLFNDDDAFLNNIVLRAGWGKVGNDGTFLGTYEQLTNNFNQHYSYDGVGITNGLGYGGVVDKDLKWEITRQTNVGLDFKLVKNKVSFSVDWYIKNSEDLLLDKQLHQEAGDPDGRVFTNLGEIENTGFDFSLNADLLDSKDFYWNANVVLSTIKNTVVDLGGPDEVPISPANIVGASGETVYVLQKGEPSGQFYGRTFLGTWKTDNPEGETPGTARYATDENGEFILGAIGNGLPTLTWGFNQVFDYKGFNVNLLFSGAHGFDVYNDTYSEMLVKNPIHPDYLNRWTPDNQTEIPTGTDRVRSSRFVEKGDFIRLTNLTLGYTFDEIKFLESAKVYVSGQNLVLITDYRGYDPEVSSTNNSTDLAPSYDKGAFPNPRTFTLGLNLNF
ncbi:SusC/RagA family TonB-linked outer membrane protein [Algibacter mikhailovii]|uniref:SusC/RagA family TonB-linked outer membrane protein n=1 Tax=Algibacter mikhailovii TaxID=425498 RepID=A0A918R4K5_9FLAO|nr:SusC/RagA family TonB-linked outer membrane protein [Algibacter mikhailovii]GGZ81796.1 SusC/RagA family TonB-linked outer membrane protein [Algibacter mikhailovii]